DSAATATDRQADELARLAASAEDKTKLDAAAQQLHLPINRVQVVENRPANLNGVIIPSVSAWAFGGAHAGETSELYDDENGYWLARLDSISEGGEPRFENVRSVVRDQVARARALDRLAPKAQQLADAAASSGLEAAAAQQKLEVQHSPLFTRGTFVPGIGQFNEAVGT